MADPAPGGLLLRFFAGRLAHVLGVDRGVARRLDAFARERLGPRKHATRAAAFAVTTGPWRAAIPERLRARAVAAYLDEALRDPQELLLLLGLSDDPITTPCGGLRRP